MVALCLRGLTLALSSTASCQSVPYQSPGEFKHATPGLGFMSYSLELSSFPDYVGNDSHPNTFSENLINNIVDLQGTEMFIRVGGNTQDYAIYNGSLSTAVVGTWNPARSPDYPTTLAIGPSFFESYGRLPNARFSHGFNLGGNHDSQVHSTLLQTVPLLCRALGEGKLYSYEYGNEADVFATSAQGPVRPLSYNESDYVEEWLAGTRAIRKATEESCPDFQPGRDTLYFMAPSFAGTNNHLSAKKAWASGLNSDGDIKYFSSHSYISGANSPGVTLEGTLMDHTVTMRSVEAHVAEYEAIQPGATHIFGEANSLYNEGRPGLSDTFGAALWAIDFCLYSASANISRVHLHMGTDYRYQSWQPITTHRTTMGTKAPYYGNIAVAAFLGNQSAATVKIAHFPLTDASKTAAYGAYVDEALQRVMLINLNSYNYSSAENSTAENSTAEDSARPGRHFVLDLTNAPAKLEATLQVLHANGSDAITGITWDAWTYDYERGEGKPVRLYNVSFGESLTIHDGHIDLVVPDSQAVVLNLKAIP